MSDLEGRVAVVTGAGRGIGRAIALRLAGAGASVIVSSRTADELDAVVGSIEQQGGRGAAVVADALSPEGARLPVREAIARFGSIDVLVNNVGGHVGSVDPFGEDTGGFERTVVLNLTSAWWTSNEALPHMQARSWGRVINIGSGASRHAAASVGYTAAKHGLVGLTKQLAVAAGPYGITVNCLCPGWTQTSLVDFDRIAAAQGTTVDEARRRAELESAQQRILAPEELTGMALLLASDEGRAITGQVIGVDGGYRL